MDANDWFANAASRPRAPERHNDFGGFLGGPIWKDKTFFFFSYEGARLRLPTTSVTFVPSASARDNSPQLAPYLKAYPVPNGPVSPDGFTAQFTGTYSNMATLDATSIRIDHSISDRFSLFGRFNDAPSQTKNRVQDLSDIETQPVNTRTLTIGFNALPNSRIANIIRANYSTQVAHDLLALSSFGGAVPLNPSLLIGSLPVDNSVGAFSTNDTGSYSFGPNQLNRTRQLNFVDDLSITVGLHHLKVGGDYRAIFLNINPARNLIEPISSSVQGLLATSTADFLFTSTRLPAQILSHSFSLYGQDSWKPTQRLALTYGVRWELAPAPSAQGNTTLASWTNVDDPAKIALAPPATPLWATTYRNFAPRVGAAYSLTEKGDFVLRAGWGIFYDLGVGSSSDLALDFPNGATGFFPSIPLPLSNVGSFLPTISTQPPFSSFVKAFSPNLKLPRSYQWNVALEKSFGSHGLLSATYVGQHGTDLLRQSSQFQPNPSFQSDFVLTENDASSNYNAVQLQYRRPLAKGLQALLNYSLSHSIDDGSNDVVAGLAHTIISGASDRGSSSFDVRHSFSGAFTLNLPGAAGPRPVTVLTEGWSLDAVIVARSGFPFNGFVLSVSPDLGGFALSRPDLVPGQPFWIRSPMAPGGQILNSSAFSTPLTIRQGTEGRNDIPGFGLTQVDLSLGRRFPITERLNLQFRADAFNLFNHPNFTNPLGFFELGAPGLQSTQMLNRGLGGLNQLFQEGGPRSLQLSLKLSF